MCRSTNRPSVAEPEVWFRILHVAEDGGNGAPLAAYRDQTVEIALRPKGAFENGNVDSRHSGLPERRGPVEQDGHGGRFRTAGLPGDEETVA